MIIERQRFDFATDEPTVRETPGSGFVDDEIRAGGLNLLRRLNQISGESQPQPTSRTLAPVTLSRILSRRGLVTISF